MDYKIVGVVFGYLVKNEVVVNDLLWMILGYYVGFEVLLELGGEIWLNEWYLSMLVVDL